MIGYFRGRQLEFLSLKTFPAMLVCARMPARWECASGSRTRHLSLFVVTSHNFSVAAV